MEFKCERCDPDHDYKTEYKLKRHYDTPSHKRRSDPEFAAAEEAEKAAKKAEKSAKKAVAEADAETNKANAEAAKMAKKNEAENEFFCSICGNGHDYKTLQNLNKHENAASHKRKIDPEFAAAEEAAKAAKKAATDKRETARKTKCRRSNAVKQARANDLQNALWAKIQKQNKAPPITETGTEEDVLSALVRYHGSTSASMFLHDDDEKIKSNIEKFINVSPEAKSEIRKAW